MVVVPSPRALSLKVVPGERAGPRPAAAKEGNWQKVNVEEEGAAAADLGPFEKLSLGGGEVNRNQLRQNVQTK